MQITFNLPHGCFHGTVFFGAFTRTSTLAADTVTFGGTVRSTCVVAVPRSSASNSELLASFHLLPRGKVLHIIDFIPPLPAAQAATARSALAQSLRGSSSFVRVRGALTTRYKALFVYLVVVDL